MSGHTKPDYVWLDFADPPADRPLVYVNMVMSSDGKVVIEGNEQGLGGPIDVKGVVLTASDPMDFLNNRHFPPSIRDRAF